MTTKHVFVETNWVVDVVAPLISRNPGAIELLERSRRGDLVLHVPVIALSEARKVIREKIPRNELGSLANIRAFVRDQRKRGDIDESAANAVFETLSHFQQHIEKEKAAAPERIAALLEESGLDVFPLDEEMLDRSTLLAAETGLSLESFDNAILAAILVRAAVLRGPAHELYFCELDHHLQPWNKHGDRRELRDLFDKVGVWVYGDFLMRAPPRPPGWPTQ